MEGQSFHLCSRFHAFLHTQGSDLVPLCPASFISSLSIGSFFSAYKYVQISAPLKSTYTSTYDYPCSQFSKNTSKRLSSPGRVAQSVGALSRYPSQGTYKKQPMNASVSGTTHQCFSLSLSNQ